MDPFRNIALQNAKMQEMLAAQRATSRPAAPDMPAPPAYETIINPNASISNAQDQQDAEEDEHVDETPEITINANTQVRGNGNVLSLPQLNMARLADLVGAIMKGERAKYEEAADREEEDQAIPVESSDGSSRWPTNVNITINCGTTIIGDRNIVGPNLGEIVRLRNQMYAQQPAPQPQTQQRTARPAPFVPGPPSYVYHAGQQAFQRAVAMQPIQHPAQGPTPPLSPVESSQGQSPSGSKRKSEDDDESAAKKQRSS